MKQEEKEHRELVSIILKRGTKHQKKHGNWVILRIKGNQFLELDSWNSAVTLKEGSGEYSYWGGFEGEPIKYYGCIWGGYSSGCTRQDYIFIIGLVKDSGLGSHNASRDYVA